MADNLAASTAATPEAHLVKLLAVELTDKEVSDAVESFKRTRAAMDSELRS